MTVDYGDETRPEWGNPAERDTRFGRGDVERILDRITKAGFSTGPVDLTYHGDEVNDYTFFRIVARRGGG